jgi:hypothetical protein
MKGITNPLQRQKVYRIVIYSKDVISGNNKDGVYQIDLPDYIQDINKYHLAVEDFTIHTQTTTAGVTRTLLVEASVTQPDTYSTSSRTSSRVLLTMSRSATADVAVSYYKPITSKTYGVPLSDLSFLRNKQLRITLRSVDDALQTDATLGNTNWVMTLIVYPFIA